MKTWIVTASSVFAVAIGSVCSAQSATSKPAPRPPAPPELDSGLVQFFGGRWKCAGEFANGRKIESDMVFTPDLENHWLQFHEDDLAPNRFHAVSFWGVDQATGGFISVIHDNFGGVRLFVSSGWNGREIAFDDARLGDAPHPDAASATQAPKRKERFSFTAQTSTTFRMQYDVSVDQGGTWKLGDYVVCSR